jgi:hypothetical protein
MKQGENVYQRKERDEAVWDKPIIENTAEVRGDKYTLGQLTIHKIPEKRYRQLKQPAHKSRLNTLRHEYRRSRQEHITADGQEKERKTNASQERQGRD